MLLKTLFLWDEFFYHKSVFFDQRGYLQVLIQKNGEKVSLDFFSKNFHYEKIILRFFYHKECSSDFTEYLSYLKKAEALLKKANSLSELEIITKKNQLPDLLNRNCSPSLNREISLELSKKQNLLLLL